VAVAIENRDIWLQSGSEILFAHGIDAARGGYEVLVSNQARASTPAPYAPGIEAAIRESLLRQLAFIRAK